MSYQLKSPQSCASAVSPLRVALRAGAHELDSVELAASSPVRFGRGHDCELQVVDAAISREHLRIELAHAGVCVTETSLNGTQASTGATLRLGANVLPVPVSLFVGAYVIEVYAPVSGAPIELEKPQAAHPLSTEASASFPEEAQVHQKISTLLSQQGDAGVEACRDDRTQLSRLIELQCLASGATAKPEEVAELSRRLWNQLFGWGPLEDLLNDPEVGEVMVVAPDKIFVERAGKLTLSDVTFADDNALIAAIERMASALGRRIDRASPCVDARLPGGMRLNAVIPPVAVYAPQLTIRKSTSLAWRLSELASRQCFSADMEGLLRAAVAAHKNILVVGGTSSGKTTLLRALLSEVDARERVVCLEDVHELMLSLPHVANLEAQPENAEGRGGVALRALVKNALRMRPDRLIIGEVRGSEALDMLLAINSGHEGSMATLHASSAIQALLRLEILCGLSETHMDSAAMRLLIAQAVDLVVVMRGTSHGRRVVEITEVSGDLDDGNYLTRQLFTFDASEGKGRPTGYLPSFVSGADVPS